MKLRKSTQNNNTELIDENPIKITMNESKGDESEIVRFDVNLKFGPKTNLDRSCTLLYGMAVTFDR